MEATARTASSTGVSPVTSSNVIPRHRATAGTHGKPDQSGAGLIRQPPRSQNRPVQTRARGEVGIGRALGSQVGSEHRIRPVGSYHQPPSEAFPQVIGFMTGFRAAIRAALSVLRWIRGVLPVRRRSRRIGACAGRRRADRALDASFHA
jgi:hypothetical protein